jgi:hypothetical protein
MVRNKCIIMNDINYTSLFPKEISHIIHKMHNRTHQYNISVSSNFPTNSFYVLKFSSINH